MAKVRITAQEIDSELTAAIKRFGTYSYYDKGAREIMDLDVIVSRLKDTDDVEYVLSVLRQLDKKKRNDCLMTDLVCSLDDWSELFESDDSVIAKYY